MAWLTPIDRVFNQRGFFYVFVGIILATTVVTLCTDSPIIGAHKDNPIEPTGNGNSLTSNDYVKSEIQKTGLSMLYRRG
jgi:hypothetical protein